jgi:hypothetical protein
MGDKGSIGSNVQFCRGGCAPHTSGETSSDCQACKAVKYIDNGGARKRRKYRYQGGKVRMVVVGIRLCWDL